jgi:hypothetical protein
MAGSPKPAQPKSMIPLTRFSCLLNQGYKRIPSGDDIWFASSKSFEEADRANLAPTLLVFSTPFDRYIVWFLEAHCEVDGRVVSQIASHEKSKSVRFSLRSSAYSGTSAFKTPLTAENAEIRRENRLPNTDSNEEAFNPHPRVTIDKLISYAEFSLA